MLVILSVPPFISTKEDVPIARSEKSESVNDSFRSPSPLIK